MVTSALRLSTLPRGRPRWKRNLPGLDSLLFLLAVLGIVFFAILVTALDHHEGGDVAAAFVGIVALLLPALAAGFSFSSGFLLLPDVTLTVPGSSGLGQQREYQEHEYQERAQEWDGENQTRDPAREIIAAWGVDFGTFARLLEVIDNLRAQDLAAWWHGKIAGILTISRVFAGAVLIVGFAQDVLPPQLVGTLGLAIFLTEICDKTLGPREKQSTAVCKAFSLRSALRGIEDDFRIPFAIDEIDAPVFRERVDILLQETWSWQGGMGQ